MQGRDLVLPDVGTAAGSPLRGARCARPRRLAAPGPASRRGPAGLRPRARRAPCRDPGALGLGPGRPSLILGPHPSRCPLAALRGHSAVCALAAGALRAVPRVLSRGPLWPRPRHAALGLGPPGAAGRPSPGSASPRRRAAARPWAPPRLRPGVALRGIRLAVWGPPCGALRASCGRPWPSPGGPCARLRRPPVPPGSALRAGAGAPSGLLPPGGCAPWRALLPPAPGRGVGVPPPAGGGFAQGCARHTQIFRKML